MLNFCFFEFYHYAIKVIGSRIKKTRNFYAIKVIGSRIKKHEISMQLRLLVHELKKHEISMQLRLLVHELKKHEISRVSLLTYHGVYFYLCFVQTIIISNINHCFISRQMHNHFIKLPITLLFWDDVLKSFRRFLDNNLFRALV